MAATPDELRLVALALENPREGPRYRANRLAEAVRVIREIRARFPLTRDVYFGGWPASGQTWASALSFYLPASFCRASTTAPRDPVHPEVRILASVSGHERLDAVTKRLGGARNHTLLCTDWDERSRLTVYFAEPINRPAALRSYAGIPDVEAEPLLLSALEDGDRVTIMLAPSYWTIVMRAAWGDCPAGCLAEHVWRFRYTPSTGSIMLERESGAPVPSDRRMHFDEDRVRSR